MLRIQLSMAGAMLFSGAALLLVHCSGGSSNALIRGDGGHGSSGGASSSGGGSSGVGGSSSGSGDDGGGSSGGSSGGSNGGTLDCDAGCPEGGSGGSSGGTGDGGSNGGGPVCEAPEGGAPCDPGAVPCGNGGTSCMTSTQYCCVANSTGGGKTETCEPYNGGSCAMGAIKIGCNEAADCTSGVCCQQILGVAMVGSTSCMPSCNYSATQTGYYQTCRSDSECGADSDAGAAKKCILQTCTSVGIGGGSSITIEACAVYNAGLRGLPGTWGPIPTCVAK